MSPAPALPLTGDAALARFRNLQPAFRAIPDTHAVHGAEPHARPLGPIGGSAASDGGTLWFYAVDRSRSLAGIARQPRASLTGPGGEQGMPEL
jgi:hypothetical protein